MFAKLLKHEFRSQARLFLFLSIAALGAGAIGSGMLALFIHFVKTEVDSAGAMIGTVFSMLVMLCMIFAILAYLVAVTILLAYRFYKYHFSDEGYLTFTLPASSHQILLSGLLNYLIWHLICGLVATVAIVIIVIPVFSLIQGELGMNQLVLDEVARDVISGNVGLGVGRGYILLQIFSGIITYIGGAVLVLVSITIGSVVAKKHKILASIGIYYGIYMVMNIITSIAGFVGVMGSFWFPKSAEGVSLYIGTAAPAFLYLIIAVGGYFLMHHLVDKKLNLP